MRIVAADASRRAALLVASMLSVCAILAPCRAGAQAWVPGEREGYLSLTYQHINLSGHFDTDGSRLEGSIPSRAHVAFAEFEYGVTDKLAFNVRLPFISSKFTGTHEDPDLNYLHNIAEMVCALTPCPEELGTLDTGGYYSTFQDWGFALRYNVLDRGIVVTPLVGLTVPSHDYRTVGEAAPGQNRLALHAGFSLGRYFHPVYIQATYAYSFVQPAHGLSLDRSNAQFEVGYVQIPRLSLRALGMWQQTHGGIGWYDAYHRVFDENDELIIPFNPQDGLMLLDHDRLLADRYWHVGGGATLSLTDSLALDGSVMTFVSGADTHYGAGVSIGLTWRILQAVPRAGPTGTRLPPPSK